MIESMQIRARAKHNAEFVKSDITNMVEFKSSAFDYVFSQYDAVSYCMRPREAIEELARVAKKGANVIVCARARARGYEVQTCFRADRT